MPDAASYGDRIAHVYDELYRAGPPDAVVLLAELAGAGGRALELGIGTGRVALPLAARGVEVHGVDASAAMVAKLRGKPGGAGIPVTIGDFVAVGEVPGGPFQLVFCAFNTFFCLPSQDAQVRCFEGVRRILAPGGRFAIEVFVPDPTRFGKHQPALVGGFDDDNLLIEASRHDPAEQRITSRLVHVRDGAVSILPIELRYAWPSELDLMARVAGLRLLQRWGGWDRRPFGSASGMHVSVYGT